MVQEQFLVLVQQGLAFGGVGDDGRNPGLQLDGGRESSPAGADDAQLCDTVEGGAGRFGAPHCTRIWLSLPIFLHIVIDFD